MKRTFEIYLTDLTNEALKELEQELGMTKEKMEEEFNWDIFPITTIYLPED